MAPDQVPPNNFPNTLANCAIRQYARGMTTSPETQRDELARDIFIADNSAHPNAGAEWDAFTDVGGVCGGDYAYDLADGLLAAGYRKPRTITTPEQVAGLPTGAVILSALGEVLRAYEGERLGWIETDSTTPVDDHEIDLPATVLWEPDA